MPSLTGAVKVFIVEHLACFSSPTDVQRWVKQDFGVDVSPQQLTAYNPDTRAGQRLSKTLRDVFETTRRSYLEATSNIAVAHKAYRLRALNKLFDRVNEDDNPQLVMQILEQAAKEAGDWYADRYAHEHAGPHGEPIPMNHTMAAKRVSSINAIFERARRRAKCAGSAT